MQRQIELPIPSQVLSPPVVGARRPATEIADVHLWARLQVRGGVELWVNYGITMAEPHTVHCAAEAEGRSLVFRVAVGDHIVRILSERDTVHAFRSAPLDADLLHEPTAQLVNRFVVRAAKLSDVGMTCRVEFEFNPVTVEINAR